MFVVKLLFLISLLLALAALTFTHLNMNKYGVICLHVICEKFSILLKVMNAILLWQLVSFS